ncbi:MAG: HAD-IC family P-type ATPase [bacterium]|nr:HAD-IC family P-type ATPase [bacterium]
MHKSGNREVKSWYRGPLHEVTKELGADLAMGLSANEARLRLERFGFNVLSPGVTRSLLERIAGELKSPLVFILLLAGITTSLLGEYVDSTVIFLALIINIAISLYQEGRADHAFERLRDAQEKFTVIIRGGEKKRVASAEIVPGDILVLEVGMSVSADARLTIAHNLEVNESPLTGEWLDVAKEEKVLDTALPPTEQKNMVFMGTLITGGSGRAIVVATGNKTVIGAIALALGGDTNARTPLQGNIARVARLLSFIVLGSLLLIFALGLSRGESLTDLLLISIAIAVAAIPEGLPAAVTVVLAIGMEAILARGGLVRNLLAAETLGSTTIILTDKTGTLTKAEMRVAHVVTLGSLELEDAHNKKESKEHEAHGDERDILEFAALASDAFIEERGAKGEDPLTEKIVHGRPVERAVVLAALESGLNQTELLHNYPRIDFLPFESKYRTALSLNHIRGLKHNRIYVTGAPEYILDNAALVYLEGKEHVKTKEITEHFTHVLKKYTNDGMRLIGVAFKDSDALTLVRGEGGIPAQFSEGLIFGGFIAFHDPLREDVPTSIALARHAGTRVIMLTGDNPETARTIAKESGIWRDGDNLLLGAEIERLSDDDLLKRIHTVSVFARMLPEHKLRLARVLTANGEVVAMTGDGVNDAPALRAASIGIALGSGTEVAKEASDLVLLNNSFSIIVAAIEEGRRIVDNLRKIVAYLLSTSFGEIIIVAGALALGLPMPILPAQILWTNILSEGFMNFAFAFEPKEDDLMARDPKRSGALAMLSRELTVFIGVVGVCLGLILLLANALFILVWELPVPEARTLTFIALTLGTVLTSFAFKDLRSSLFSTKVHSNKYLLGSTIFALVGLIFALSFDPLANLLRLVPIDFVKAAPVLLGVVIANIAVVEVAKYFLFERRVRGVVR